MPQENSAFLSSRNLQKEASRVPTLEAFAQSLLEKALFGAAEKIGAGKFETESVKLNCEVTITPNPHVKDGGGCVTITLPPDDTHRKPYQVEYCWGPERAR